MNQLPIDEKLNIGYLSRILDPDRTNNCYKFFWFQAILNKLDEEHTRFTYDELINEMIVDAWYMVAEYHLRLGPVTDNLEEVVKYIIAKKGFAASEKREVILAYLENSDDAQLRKYKKILTDNVPYRLQSPFYDGINTNDYNLRPSDFIEKVNRQKRLLYYFDSFQKLSTTIVVNDNWVPYLLRNREILLGWLQLKLINYLQKKNPSVPGIADKLNIPQARDIERVRRYWKLIIEIKPEIKDIYGNVDLANENISVDHFVPWQYVAHDELWNLHPTTKSINSSKSNGLPDWDMYFAPLYKLEFLSYKLAKENDNVAGEFDKISKYHLNNEEIKRELYCDGLTETEFGERLNNVVRPVYNAARNNGFKVWKYEKVTCQ